MRHLIGTVFNLCCAWICILNCGHGGSGGALAREVAELQTLNFELTITSFQYLAVLFYDSSEKGMAMEKGWLQAAATLENNSLCSDCAISKIDGQDPDLRELVDAYMLKVPCIRVFRRGVMADWRGPSPDGSNNTATASVAAHLREDSQPSVQLVRTLPEIKAKLRFASSGAGPGNSKTVVLGFFNISEEEALGRDDTVAAEGYGLTPWGQFQAAADALRGHATFLGLLPDEQLLSSFKVSRSELPSLYLLVERGDSLVPFGGELLEASITEWVLRFSLPGVDELSFARSSGELYATQFFSAKRLKFILFLPAGSTAMTEAARSTAVAKWKTLADTFRTQAFFAYMQGASVPDVLEYFELTDKDLPAIAAHEPAKDYKYVSSRQLDLTESPDQRLLESFVAGVISGRVQRVMRSEPMPRSSKRAGSSRVKRLVGSTVLEVVSAAGTDVLLEVFAPWCAHCRRLSPTLDILARSVAAEDRIVVAKIDGTANDVPASWGVKTYPSLLWFPAKDKPYSDSRGPIPRPYWDAGTSLGELSSFLQRHSSFDPKTLRVATSEQLSSLMADEDVLRGKYEVEARHEQRNEGREVWDNEALDWLLGEVVFDGRRWHVALTGVLALFTLVLFAVVLLRGASLADSTLGASSKVKKKKKST